MKRLAAVVMLLSIGIAAWARYQSPQAKPDASLARWMPQGALLFLEGKDFAGLLHDWTASPEKQSWLKSDNYEAFSRSRLFMRLQAAQQEFATAAGVPPNTGFLAEVAGKRTALGIYNIGELEMLYITELPSAQATQSGIWQQRSTFEPRESAGEQFFVRTDPQSGRTVAFAVKGDYLILATRDDLVAGALSAMKGEKTATIDREGWFADALKNAKDPGDLRMVMHLEEIAKTPHFRTYWIQQNITATRGYESGVSDLYRSAGEYREERALVRKSRESDSGSNSAAADLAQLAPPESGFFSSQLQPSSDEVIAAIEQKVLMPRSGPAPASEIAPTANLSDGTTGSANSLEEHIDVPPATPQAAAIGDDGLKDLIKANPPAAMLKVQGSESMSDGVFVKLGSAVVLSGANPWDEAKLRSAIQHFVAPATTASSLGAGWRSVSGKHGGYSEFDGLLSVSIAVRGKYLFMSNDAGLLDDLLGRVQQKPAAGQAAIYLASFNHERERQHFYRFTALVDQPSRNVANPERNPEFFSDNLSSLSKSLAQNLVRESIAIYRNGNIERQTVHYVWSH